MELAAIMDGAANDDTFGECISSLVDTGSIESHRYFLARRTMLEMLRDRGFAIPQPEIEISLQQFRSTYGPIPDPDKLRVATALQSDATKKLLVVFCGPAKVKKKVIEGILGQIVNKETLHRLILVVEDMTPQASKFLATQPLKVEVFQITDLLVNITKHTLMPKHRVLTDKEKKNLLKQHNLTEQQLPRMSEKDAIAKYYGLVKGQVVKVMYSGDKIESHVTYRCVWG